MSDQSLFDQTPSDAVPAPSATPLEELVGEGKKFKSVDDLARGKLESDKFIEKLQEEQRLLREDLQKYAGLEEKVQGLLKAQEVPAPSTPATAQPSGSVEQPDIDQLINERLTAHEQAKLADSNFQKSQTAVMEAYGNDAVKAREAIQKRAMELGVTPEYLGQQAKQSPTAFAALMGLNAPRQPSAQPTVGDYRSTPTGANTSPEAGTKAYYDKLRRENPQLYYSPAIQNEVYKAAAANPEQWR